MNTPTDPENISNGYIKKVLNKALSVQGFGFIAAIFGIGVLVLFLSKLGLSLITIALSVIGFIFLAVLYVIFTWVIESKKKSQSIPALILVWSVTGVVSLTFILLFLSVFFNGPLKLRYTISNYINAQNNASTTVPVMPVKDTISMQYSRLAGAIEVPILVQIQSFGGTYCKKYGPGPDDTMCNIGPDIESNPIVGFDVTSGHIDKTLSDFWDNKWPFKDALPIGTQLFKDLANNNIRGVELLNEIDPSYKACINAFINPWDDEDKAKLLKKAPWCETELTKNVGFLFLILKNESINTLKGIDISYDIFLHTDRIEFYVSSLNDKTASVSSQSLKLLELKPEKSVIFLLSIYERNMKSGFEKRFLYDALIPRKMSYKIGNKMKSIDIRAPLREEAAVVLLPFGWYQQ